jgi:hypothetical protein
VIPFSRRETVEHPFGTIIGVKPLIAAMGAYRDPCPRGCAI